MVTKRGLSGPVDVSLLAAVFEGSPAPMAILDRDLRFVRVNAAYCSLFGLEPSDFAGQTLFERFPDQPGTDGQRQVGESLRSVLATGRAETMPLLRYDVEDPVHRGQFREHYWSVTNFAVRSATGAIDHVVIQPEEVTRFVEERLRRQVGERHGQSMGVPAAVHTVYTVELRRLEALATFSEALVAAKTIASIGRAVVRDGRKMVGADAASFLALDGTRFRVLEHDGVEATATAAWREFTLAAGVDPFSDAVLRSEPLFFETRDDLLDRYPDLAATVEGTTHHSWVFLPLLSNDVTMGAIGMIYDQPSAFTVPRRLGLSTIRDLTAQATERAVMLAEHEVLLTAVEDAIRERTGPSDAIAVSSLYRPATNVASAGGDFYEFIELDDDHLVFAIGDVASHGVDAAGEMGRARIVIQTLATVADGDPARLATQASAALDRAERPFTTACLAAYRPSTGRLTLTNAGHPYPAIRRRDGTVELLSGTDGPPLGLRRIEDTPYTSSEHRLWPGDTLVLYTDGLIERRDESIDQGIDRLVELIAALPDDTDMAARLFRELCVGPHDDDIAVMTITARESGPVTPPAAGRR